MVSEMLERVARKLWDEIGGECGDDECRWGKSCYCVDTSFSLAKTAITAMREPTEEMIDAGAYDLDIKLETQYKNMIDAALKE